MNELWGGAGWQSAGTEVTLDRRFLGFARIDEDRNNPLVTIGLPCFQRLDPVRSHK